MIKLEEGEEKVKTTIYAEEAAEIIEEVFSTILEEMEALLGQMVEKTAEILHKVVELTDAQIQELWETIGGFKLKKA